MTHCYQPQARTPFTRFVHALLLLAWLLSSQGIAPALVLAAASMDGDHAVKVGATEKGHVTVVLAHDGGTSKEHDTLCAFIVSFAETSPEDHADHVLSFKAVEDASRRVLEDVAHVDLVVPVVSLKIKRHALNPPVADTRRTPAPAWSPGLQVKAAKTILLC